MTAQRNRFCGMLGLAMRAGKVIIGTEPVCAAMAKQDAARPKLVILCADASANTRKKVTVKAAFYGIDVLQTEMPSGEIGQLLGKTYAPMAIAVTDVGFAAQLRLAAETAGPDGENVMRKGSFRTTETGDTDDAKNYH